jgi:hypothetical protein
MDLYDDKFWEWMAQCPVEHNADPDNVDMYGQRLAGVNFFIEEEDDEQ